MAKKPAKSGKQVYAERSGRHIALAARRVRGFAPLSLVRSVRRRAASSKRGSR